MFYSLGMSSFKYIWNYIRKYKWLYIAGIATLFVVDFASLFIPKLTGEITDGLSSGDFTMRDVIIRLGYILIFGVIMTLGRVGWRFFFMGTSRDVERDIRNDMFEHLSTLSSRYFQTMASGDLMSRFSNDLSSIRQAIGPAIISLFDGTVMTIMVLFQMVFYVDYRLTIITMIPMVLIAIGVGIYGGIMHRLSTDRQEALASLTDYTRESFTGIRVIKSFVREKYRIREFIKENINTRDKTLKLNYMVSLVWPLLDLIIELSIFITLIYGGYLTIQGKITLGRFVAYNQYIIMLIWPMMACGDAVNSFSQGAASIDRIREVMNEEPEIIDGPEVIESEIDDWSLSAKNLTFTYPEREDAGLFDICFDHPSGKCLAITGKTGCGKTTFAELLVQVYRVPVNCLFIGGRDINSIGIKYLRDNIAYVPQDDFLFSDTILNNILFGVKNNDFSNSNAEALAVRYAKEACVHDNIMDFSEKYNTWVGERGVTLSGGQKQRICIARALIKSSKILILDDAMSAVDTDTERQLISNIFRLREGQTTIIIAHRITAISRADHILVMDEGRIVQQGTHEALVDIDGTYRDLYLRQQLEDEYKGVLG